MDAVKDACESGQLGGYSGDAWYPQPPPEDHCWRYMPNQAMTPHLSGTTIDAQARYAHGVQEMLEQYFSGKPLSEENYTVREGELAPQFAAGFWEPDTVIVSPPHAGCSDDEEESICSICRHPVGSTVQDGQVGRHSSKVNSCNHRDCFACLLKWAQEFPSCPTCRKELREITCVNSSGFDVGTRVGDLYMESVETYYKKWKNAPYLNWLLVRESDLESEAVSSVSSIIWKCERCFEEDGFELVRCNECGRVGHSFRYNWVCERCFLCSY